MRDRKTGENVLQYVAGVQRLFSEGANFSLRKAMDISLYLESTVKQTAAIQNEFKQPNETV